jgi:hypothetical protein
MTLTRAKASTNETFIVQASLTIIAYDCPNIFIVQTTGKSYRRERLSTVDLLVLTSLYQLLFILKILFTFLTSYFNEEVNCPEPSSLLSIPCRN